MTEESLLRLSKRVEKDQLIDGDLEILNRFFFSFEEEVPRDLDLIVVLAGEYLNRIQAAVHVYEQKKVPILVSGGSINEKGEREWERYFRYAEAHGVVYSDLIIEAESTNTYQNLVNIISIIKKKQLSPCRIVFISSTQHLLRVSLTLRKILESFPIDFNYSFYPTYAKNIRKENWRTSQSSRKELAKEIQKIIEYQLVPYLNF